MTEKLTARLKFLRPFSGVPSYGKEIESIEDALSSVDGVTAQQFNERNAEQDAAILLSGAPDKGNRYRDYFVGGPLGNNNNDGSQAAPFLDLAHAFSQMDFSQLNRIRLLGSQVIDSRIIVGNTPMGLDIIADTGAEKITFTGIGRISFQGSCDLQIIGADLVNDKGEANYAFDFNAAGSVRLNTLQSEYTLNAVGAGALNMFNINTLVPIEFRNFIEGPNAVGRLFKERFVANQADRFAFIQ